MKDKVALVMGGGAGTGRATALAFARAGARVVVADINSEGADTTAAEVEAVGGDVITVVADMGSAEDIQQLMETIRNHFGGLHAVSNNAAAGQRNLPITEISEEDWNRCMNVTLKGVWLAMKYQLPLIEASGGGAIVNIASVAGMRGDPFQSCYAAAKAGVINLTKTAAVEYAKRGVRVNAVSPGGIRSGGMDFYLEKMPEMKQKVLDTHAMGRMAEPGEIADSVVYLCSDQSSFVTGHNLVVDGGILVRSNVIDL